VRRFIEKTFQLETMVSDRSEDGLKISWSGKDKSENPVSLVMTRSQPELPKEEGHHPWEYWLEGLVLKQGDILRDIDPLNPQ
jgi:hypothetical protein